MQNQCPENKRKVNWLLLCLFSISVIIHLFVFRKVAKVYRKNNLSVIEVTLQGIPKLPVRDIPRPRPRPRKAPQPPVIPEIPKIIPTELHPPRLNPIKLESYKAGMPESLVEGIHIPKGGPPDISRINITEWDPEAVMQDAFPVSSTPETYLDLVRLKIEREKKYPSLAKMRQFEGRVTVQFTITKDGEIGTAKVIKGSHYKILDAAALRAIRDAAPFPKPPHQFFKGDVSLKLVITFILS